MRKTFVSKIKDMLETEKKEIEIRAANKNLDIDTHGDETDAIQAKILAMTSQQLLVRDKNKLVKIENALRKISEGNFGSCEECEEEIAEKRLLANPGSITCISCAEALEMLKKRSG